MLAPGQPSLSPEPEKPLLASKNAVLARHEVGLLVRTTAPVVLSGRPAASAIIYMYTFIPVLWVLIVH